METHQEYTLIKMMRTWTTEVGRVLLHAVLCYIFVITFLDLEWFNVSRPLSLSKDLRGKIAVLDFFTYCCINCMHILPQLKQLEKQYSTQEGVVVVSESSDS